MAEILQTNVISDILTRKLDVRTRRNSVFFFSIRVVHHTYNQKGMQILYGIPF